MHNMITLTELQKEIVTSALKLKLASLLKLEKSVKAELGENSEAAKNVLKEVTAVQELFREIELSKTNRK